MKRKILSIFLICLNILYLMPIYRVNATEATAVYDFDKSTVEQDLTTAKQGTKTFNFNEYGYDGNGQITLITVAEFMLRENLNMDNYGLYFYIYNPQKLEIKTSNTTLNKVQIATEFDINGNPVTYEKFRIKCMDISDNGCIYKFKIEDVNDANHSFKQIVKNYATLHNERKYCISGYELYISGNDNATEYNVGGIYIFTGYAKGCGSGDICTLNSSVTELQTVKLNLRQTYYRPASLGEGTVRQLNSVYFTIPKKILNEYGNNITRIKAEWYEYKTAPIFITSNREFYDELYGDFQNDEYGVGTDGYSYYINLDIGNSSYSVPFSVFDSIDYPTVCYNGRYWSQDIDEYIPRLSYLFYCSDIQNNDLPTVSREKLVTWMRNYYHYCHSPSNANSGIVFPHFEKGVSEHLFAESIDADRIALLNNPTDKRGYIVRNFSTDTKLSLIGYDSTHSAWDRFWAYLWRIDNVTEDREYNVFQSVNISDLTGDVKTDCDNLFIAVEDYLDFVNYLNENKDKGTTFLFRFAETDYTTKLMYFGHRNDDFTVDSLGLVTAKNGLIAQETVFLDFDVIEFEFQKDGVYTTIPIVASPINVIGGITVPDLITTTDIFDKLKKLFALFLFIVMIVLIVFVFVRVIKLFVKITVQGKNKHDERNRQKKVDKILENIADDIDRNKNKT